MFKIMFGQVDPQYTFAQFRDHFEYLNSVEQLKAHAHVYV